MERKKIAAVAVIMAVFVTVAFLLHYFPIIISGCSGSTSSADVSYFTIESADDETAEWYVGKRYTMGSYEQDGNSGNGKEDIQWTVLAVESDRALLITESLLDYKPYHSTKTGITWENCSLRDWLNSTFFTSAFSSSEQDRILLTELSNDNSSNGTKGGNDTNDHIFALSVREAKIYFSSDSQRTAYCTEWAYGLGLCTHPNREEWWWLRSPGRSGYYAALVDYTGKIIDNNGDFVNDNDITVRPAMWIKI